MGLSLTCRVEKDPPIHYPNGVDVSPIDSSEHLNHIDFRQSLALLGFPFRILCWIPCFVFSIQFCLLRVIRATPSPSRDFGLVSFFNWLPGGYVRSFRG